MDLINVSIQVSFMAVPYYSKWLPSGPLRQLLCTVQERFLFNAEVSSNRMFPSRLASPRPPSVAQKEGYFKALNIQPSTIVVRTDPETLILPQ